MTQAPEPVGVARRPAGRHRGFPAASPWRNRRPFRKKGSAPGETPTHARRIARCHVRGRRMDVGAQARRLSWEKTILKNFRSPQARPRLFTGFQKALWLICAGRGQAPNFTRPGRGRCFIKNRILKRGFLEALFKLKIPR